MIETKCASCGKAYSFDPASTQHKLISIQLSQVGSATAIFYPVCPHCDKQNAVTMRTGK